MTPAGPGAHAGEAYLVKARRTPFYRFGPAQAGGPDFALSQGQRVTMLSYLFGYSHVAIEGAGQSGYVATEDLAPAPPRAASTPTVSHSRRSPSHAALTPPSAGQSQIPFPAFPESAPPPGAPTFRY